MEDIFSASTNPEQSQRVHDDWLEDGSDSYELNRESEAREKEFRVMGYRDGIIAGKESSAQEGFNTGFMKAVHGGLKLGFIKGATSALAALPDPLKVKLVDNVVDKDRLSELCGTVPLISMDDVSRKFGSDMAIEAKGFEHMERDYEDLKSLLRELGHIKLPEKD